jgi:SnoaL-like domain
MPPTNGAFGELLRGPQEIRAKWAASMDQSGQSTCEFEILAITDGLGFVRWLASYTYPAKRQRVRYDGVFVVRLTSEDLCSEFREWWNTQSEAL